MTKKIKPTYAFAAYNPARGFGLNSYWIRGNAKEIRATTGGRNWKSVRRDGWRIVKVKVIAVGNPR